MHSKIYTKLKNASISFEYALRAQEFEQALRDTLAGLFSESYVEATYSTEGSAGVVFTLEFSTPEIPNSNFTFGFNSNAEGVKIYAQSGSGIFDIPMETPLSVEMFTQGVMSGFVSQHMASVKIAKYPKVIDRILRAYKLNSVLDLKSGMGVVSDGEYDNGDSSSISYEVRSVKHKEDTVVVYLREIEYGQFAHSDIENFRKYVLPVGA